MSSIPAAAGTAGSVRMEACRRAADPLAAGRCGFCANMLPKASAAPDREAPATCASVQTAVDAPAHPAGHWHRRGIEGGSGE